MARFAIFSTYRGLPDYTLIMQVNRLYFAGIWFLIGLLLFSNNQASQAVSLESSFKRPYVIIYGRDSCLFTQNMKKELKRAGIVFKYQIIDKDTVKHQLYPRMTARGLSIKEFTLPVVEVNNEILVHPSPITVIDKVYFN